MARDPFVPLVKAEFNPLIRPYLVIYVGIIMALTIFFIPVAVLWFCGMGQWWARHYFLKLECELGPTGLRFRKGIIFQVEKTIPIENLQDVTFIEGPLLKYFQLSILKFETAGQSAGQAHNMRLIGIIDAHQFRAQLLRRREALKHRLTPEADRASHHDVETFTILRAILCRLDEISIKLPRFQACGN